MKNLNEILPEIDLLALLLELWYSSQVTSDIDTMYFFLQLLTCFDQRKKTSFVAWTQDIYFAFDNYLMY